VAAGGHDQVMTESDGFDDWSFGVIDQVNDPHNTVLFSESFK